MNLLDDVEKGVLAVNAGSESVRKSASPSIVHFLRMNQQGYRQKKLCLF
jgi:hypothetical protein